LKGGRSARDEWELLMLPGPTDVPEEVYEALSRSLINHRGREFRELHRSLIDKLRRVVGTSGDVFVLTCSGTGGVEAALSNTIERGDRVVAFVSGQFGERMAAAASYYTDNLSVVEQPWRRAPTAEDVKRALGERDGVNAVLLVHNETSTGALAPAIERIAEECRRAGALLIVDAVTSLGGVKFGFDQAGIDVLVAGTQKCLAAPPGLAVIAVSEKAWEKIESLKKRPAYFDLLLHRKFMERGETPYTPAISLFYGLDAAVSRIISFGVERWIERHGAGAEAYYRVADELGLEIYPEPGFRSTTLIAIRLPDGVQDTAVAETMAEKFGVHVGVGVSRERGRMIRIGSMGEVTAWKTKRTLRALCEALRRHGVKLPPSDSIIENIVDECFSSRGF